MTNVIRTLLVYGLCLPGAVLIGYMLSMPMTVGSLVIVLAIGLVLVAPFLLRWHHPMLIAAWNMSVVVFFLPGSPRLWLLLAGVSLGISVLQRAMFKEMRFVWVPSVAWPLLMLAVVAIVTAKFTGGIGLRAVGSEMYGGKRYVLLLGAIIGYFALTAHPIPAKRAPLMVGLFFLGCVTALMGSIVPWIPQSLYFLYNIFPVEERTLDVVGYEIVAADTLMLRVRGVTLACFGVFAAMLSRWGIQGVFDFRHGWRVLLFVGVCFLSLLGGFRSVLIEIALTFAILFYLEGLFRTRLFPILLIGFLLVAACTLPFADRLPLSIQRSLSFLPVKVDPVAEFDAKLSTEWRVDIWKMMVPLIPKYFWMGKGYAINPREMELAADAAMRRGESTEFAAMAGAYHNGPLSVIIPLGIFGTVAFLWFLIAATRLMYANYRYGDSSLHLINTFLLAYFVERIFHFFVIYGDLETSMVMFAGLAGLSVCVNGGVRKPETQAVQATVSKRVDLAGMAR